ncbi:MAG: hypothetical protein AUJ75_03630, partial [Candidatus Omnitrophica bacterium CG1_02_49_10]
AESSSAAAIIIPSALSTSKKSAIKSDNPKLCFAKLLGLYMPADKPKPGVHKAAVIGAGAEIAKSAHIGAYAVIGEGSKVDSGAVISSGVIIGESVYIGEDTVINPNVTVYKGVSIGKRVIIHGGGVIGGDGFGYAKDGDSYYKVPQVGNVVIEDDVEIGSNVTIDRATIGSTIIKRGTKIDNLVQIGHNDIIGENSVICAQTGISGSSVVGRRCTFAGQVGVSDHVNIGENVIVGAQSGIPSDVEGNQVLLGSPVVPIMQAKRQYGAFAKLPKLIIKVSQLIKRIDDLEKRLAEIDGRK